MNRTEDSPHLPLGPQGEAVMSDIRSIGDRDYFVSVCDPSLLETPLTAPALLQHAANKWPDRRAVSDCLNGRSLTWSELNNEVGALAARLRSKGAGKGNAFVLASLCNVDFLIWLHAISRIGAVSAPLNLQNSPAEVRYFVDTIGQEFDVICVADADFKASFATVDVPKVSLVPDFVDEHWGTIENIDLVYRHNKWSDVEPDDPVYIIATSGSTAAPKATLARHRSLGHYAQACAWGMNLSGEDRYLNLMPWYHTGGLGFALGALPLTGAELLLLPKIQAASALETIERYRVTAACGFDGFFSMIEALPEFEPRRVRSLRAIMLGGMSGYYDQLIAWGVETIFSFYGMTEGHIVTVMPPDEMNMELRRSSQGVPLGNIALRIVDPESGEELPEGEIGEIQFAGPNVMLRYIGMPDQTTEAIGPDGFVRSGDRGYVKGGHLYFLGRYKFVIKSGGENVSEAEVEKFIAANVPGVESVIVVGVADKTYGEIVCACIEWKVGFEMDLEAIRDICRGRLSGFKIPRRIERVRSGEWPRTASGKVDRLAMKRIANEGSLLSARETEDTR